MICPESPWWFPFHKWHHWESLLGQTFKRCSLCWEVKPVTKQ